MRLESLRDLSDLLTFVDALLLVVQCSRLPSRVARARSWLEAAVSRTRVYLHTLRAGATVAQIRSRHAGAYPWVCVNFPELRIAR
jgi:hypothetical protein